MVFAKLRLVALAILLMGAIATGAGFGTYAVNASTPTGEGEPPSEPRRNPARTEPRPATIAQDANEPSPGRMFVVGRVLDQEGKSVPDASAMVYARSTIFRPAASAERSFSTELGWVSCDKSGRFRVDIPRTASSRHHGFGAVALAPGYGTAWVDLDPDADQPTADIVLRPEQVIHGRYLTFKASPPAMSKCR